jgi:hypothetical protein
MAIAVWPMPAVRIERVVDAALEDSRLRGALEQEAAAAFSAHLLPADYGMVNMFADVGTDHRMFSKVSPGRFKYLLTFILPFAAPDLKHRIMGSPQDAYKVVFSRVDKPGHQSIAVDHVIDLSAKMTPVVIADVRSSDSAADPLIQDVVTPPRRSFWGDMTMPMF